MRRIPAHIKIAALVIAVLAVLALAIVHMIKNAGLIDDPAYVPEAYGEITFAGSVYKPDSLRINVLMMGIDAEGKAVSSNSYMNSGLADFLCLLSFNIRTQECIAIHINRDTITDVSMYGIGRARLGKAPMQIALAHQYGDGLDFSCLNTVEAVSALLKKIKIHYYVSLHMDAISVLNDIVGGVEVLIEDDFSELDPTMVAGKTVKLKGKQAELFVRGRKGVSDQSNLSRMKRQSVYMSALYEKFVSSKIDITDIYKQLGEYVVTNCDVKRLEKFSEVVGDYTLTDIVSIPGEAVVADGLIEYHVDEDGLTKLIVDYLYKKAR